jgi:hypothetical protein
MGAERCIYISFDFSVYINIYNYNNQIYHCYYATSGYHRNELSSVNMRVLQLWSGSQTREQNFVECIVSIL